LSAWFSLGQRKNWLSFLFSTYGVPALLMIAVLPANHVKTCACFRPDKPMVHAPFPAYYCPACTFLSSTSLTVPEDAASAGAPQLIAYRAPAIPVEIVSCSVIGASRAHSPPFA